MAISFVGPELMACSKGQDPHGQDDYAGRRSVRHNRQRQGQTLGGLSWKTAFLETLGGLATPSGFHHGDQLATHGYAVFRGCS